MFDKLLLKNACIAIQVLKYVVICENTLNKFVTILWFKDKNIFIFLIK